MDVNIKRMKELSSMIINLQKAKEELVEIWFNNADGCEYVVRDDDNLAEYEMTCTHSAAGSDPACMYNNCPLLKQ